MALNNRLRHFKAHVQLVRPACHWLTSEHEHENPDPHNSTAPMMKPMAMPVQNSGDFTIRAANLFARRLKEPSTLSEN